MVFSLFSHKNCRPAKFEAADFYRPHPKDGGRLYFQSVHTCGGVGGVPHPRSGWGAPHLRSGWGVPCPSCRWGVTPSQFWVGVPRPRSRLGGYPISGLGRGVPHPRSGWWDVPWVSPNQVWMVGSTSDQVWMVGGYLGYPPDQDWMGYPPLHPLDRAA